MYTCLQTAPKYITPILLFFTMCGTIKDAGNSIDPPYQIHSILPLQIGLHWQYEFYVYGSSGELISKDSNLTLHISKVWLIQNEAGLKQVSDIESDIDSSHLCFGYEWEHQGQGTIIQYKSDTIPGIYKLGTFNHDSCTLFSSPRLWLAYPADQGFSYFLNEKEDVDSSQVVKMEVASVKDTFYFADNQCICGLSFMECYLYKENRGDTTNYYYYHPDYGALGYQQVYHTQLRKTYKLKFFSVH